MLDVKANFKNFYDNDFTCRTCKIEGSIEDENHLLECEELSTEAEKFVFEDVLENWINKSKH